MKELDLVKKLRNAPKGLKLYSPLVGEVKLDRIVGVSARDIPSIYVVTDESYDVAFLNDGKYIDLKDAECLLFPRKDVRDWSRFQIPKVGDLVKLEGDDFTCKISKLRSDSFEVMRDGKLYCGDVSYLMNFEIIEQPKFKIGDVVIAKNKPCKILGYNNENHYYVCHSPYPCDSCVKIEDIRPTTKQELRDKYNLMLDENKNLVRWMPKSNEKYWYISAMGEIFQVDNTNNLFDIKALKIKNCFPNKKLARKKLKEVIKTLKE